MDSQESPSVHQQQEQEQLQPPRGYGKMASPPNPPPPQPYQQEQQPPPHNHGEMEETLTLPSSPSPPQRQNHQQEQTNSYMLPAAKIIFHQPQRQKKRGRPKKYFDDGLRNSPTLTSKAPGASSSETPSKKSHGRLLRSRKKTQPQPLDSNASGDDFAFSENPAKKLLKRPSFSGDKMKQEDLGVLGSGWVPHLIPINIGEDIVHKVMTFIEQGPEPQIFKIISASGLVSDVTLRKFSTGGGTVTYESQFAIISLSGSLLLSKSKGNLRITGDLSVSLSMPYNKVMSGVISGSLKAASPVQVVLCSFILDKENTESKAPFTSLPPNVLNFGASVTEVTSTFRGASSNLADENGDSPFNHEREVSINEHDVLNKIQLIDFRD